MTDHDRYAYPHRVLHWGVAFVLVVSLASGLALGFLGFEGAMERFGDTLTNLLYMSHKTFGVIILALMTARIFTRWLFVVPIHEPPLTPFQRILSTSVHHLLYLALIVQPVLGWTATATGGYPVQFFQWNLPGLIGENKALSEQLFLLHGLMGWAILGLVGLHIAGALFHWLVKQDGVMKRMSLF